MEDHHLSYHKYFFFTLFEGPTDTLSRSTHDRNVISTIGHTQAAGCSLCMVIEMHYIPPISSSSCCLPPPAAIYPLIVGGKLSLSMGTMVLYLLWRRRWRWRRWRRRRMWWSFSSIYMEYRATYTNNTAYIPSAPFAGSRSWMRLSMHGMQSSNMHQHNTHTGATFWYGP